MATSLPELAGTEKRKPGHRGQTGSVEAEVKSNLVPIPGNALKSFPLTAIFGNLKPQSRPRGANQFFVMTKHKIVFLFDVDNTLLDNDRVTADLDRHLRREVGPERAQRYWAIFERLRAELGYADYLGALQRYRIEYPRDPHLLTVSSFLVNYPFAERLYPKALDAITHVRQWGPVVILSDGDVVFQPRKVERSGLFEAVAGNALIYVHKEKELDDVTQRYPAGHYVMVDDKLRILAAMKQSWRDRLTTIFPRQGHYALDLKITAAFPPADITIECIGELLSYSLTGLAGTRSL